jgi:4-amino-4-deoxy-L-arabinose transferase-like glycosyltransferase
VATSRATVGIFLLVAASFAVRIVTLDQPLVEAHSFRQTQTAYPAVLYHRHGIDLLHTPVPVLGPPWEIPFELPLFQAIASVLIGAGLTPEVALRGASLIAFAATVAVVYRMVREEVDSQVARLAAVAALLAPLGLLWSRTSTIESLALLLTIACVHLLLRYDRHRGSAVLLASAALAIIAAMVKITTFGVWLLPGIFLLPRSRGAAVLVLGVGGATGLAWTAFADSIKAASPATSFLTSRSLLEWNFGTLTQRLDPAMYVDAGRWLAGVGLVVLLAPLLVRRNRLYAWSAATLVSGPLVFFNLYVEHDYYWMAVLPAAAILIGGVVTRFVREPSPPIKRRRLILAGLLFVVSFLVYDRWALMFGAHDEAHVLERAAQVRSATAAGTLVAISDTTWSPAILYYADRYGYMEYPDVPPAPVGYVRFVCPPPDEAGMCVPDSP